MDLRAALFKEKGEDGLGDSAGAAALIDDKDISGRERLFNDEGLVERIEPAEIDDPDIDLVLLAKHFFSAKGHIQAVGEGEDCKVVAGGCIW